VTTTAALLWYVLLRGQGGVESELDPPRSAPAP
jgi:hypothetical protein